MLTSWQFEQLADDQRESCIGHFNPTSKTLQVLYRFGECVEVLQATINKSLNLLAFVIKKTLTPQNDEQGEHSSSLFYFPYVVEIRRCAERLEPTLLIKQPSKRQVMTQFLWRSEQRFDQVWQEKLLVMTHGQSKLLVFIKFFW